MNFCTELDCLLDLAGKACQGKHYSLFRKIVKYGQKSFITLGPGMAFPLLFTVILRSSYNQLFKNVL